MRNNIPRVEAIEGEVITDGTQWISTTVNGVHTGLPVHVYPDQIDKAKDQLEALLRRVYDMGYKNGISDVRKSFAELLGL